MKNIKFLGSFIFFIFLLNACDTLPSQKEVGICCPEYDLVNMTVDCDANSDGVYELKDVPVAFDGNKLKVLVGTRDNSLIMGNLVTYSDRAVIEQVYVK